MTAELTERGKPGAVPRSGTVLSAGADPSKGQDARTTRERLLEAAGEVFGELGFAGATVRSICLRANTNVAAINYHFGDKETLHREVLGFAFQRLHARFPLEDDPRSPLEDRARSFVEVFLRRLFSVGGSWHGQMMARELTDPSGALSDVVHTYMRPLLGTLDGIVATACPQLDEETRRLHAFSLMGQCVFFKHARPILDRLFGPDAYGQERIPALTDHIVSIFLRGLPVEGGAR